MTNVVADYYYDYSSDGGGSYYGDDDEYVTPDSVLLALVQSYAWADTMARIQSHPDECKAVGVQGRTPLHVACDHDAPAMVVEALLKAYPEASLMVGTSNMNPLHITCSSQHANIQVVNTLLESGHASQTSMRDVDGDTPLHAACRCGAPIHVIRVLLEANPNVVDERDYEGLTPLLRLWVRYFVILGDDVIEGVRGEADLQQNAELGEAWRKTELLLRCAHLGSLGRADPTRGCKLPANYTFRAVHAAAAVDCPRPVVKIATILHPEQVTQWDEMGMTPLAIAARAPIFKVHDLSDDGYELEDQIHGDNSSQYDEDEDERMDDDGDGDDDANNDDGDSTMNGRLGTEASNTNNMPMQSERTSSGNQHPSVIQILVKANPRAATIPSRPDNRLPLHHAVASGKQWKQGIQTILDVYPDASSRMDTTTGLFPFLQAATIDQPDCSTILELLRADPSVVDHQDRRRESIRVGSSPKHTSETETAATAAGGLTTTTTTDTPILSTVSHASLMSMG